jgi:hypothetical protein
MPDELDLDQLEIEVAEANPAVARIRVRVSRSAAAGAERLTGFVKGPYCDRARTLPATFPLVDQGGSDPLEAEAVVPDPCFWTAELPFVYEVAVPALGIVCRIGFRLTQPLYHRQQ